MKCFAGFKVNPFVTTFRSHSKSFAVREGQPLRAVAACKCIPIGKKNLKKPTQIQSEFIRSAQ